MTGNLLSIAASGIAAARAGLDVTAQNIANAATSGYVRESVNQAELSSPQSTGVPGETAMSGVVVTGIARNADTFLQQQARSAGADAARADGLVTNLQAIDNAVEQSGLYTSITQFQSGLAQLAGNPTSTSLRASALANAQQLTQSFTMASTALGQTMQGMQQEAAAGVSQVNTLAQGLARINQQIAANPDIATTGASLLDQRDTMLSQLSRLADITTSIAANGTVSVQMGGASGPQLVNGQSATALGASTAANGTIAFDLGGTAIAVSGGSLAADQQGLTAASTASARLDGMANSLISAVNTAQTAGSDLNGGAGVAFFSGAGAGGITVALTSGSQIATAPAAAAPGSTDITNLTAIQSAITTAAIPGQADSLIFDLSSAVSSATTTQTALGAIATQANAALSAQAGVDLNTEAAKLLQYQQAFQASGKVIQVASTLFNQLLQIQ